MRLFKYFQKMLDRIFEFIYISTSYLFEEKKMRKTCLFFLLLLVTLSGCSREVIKPNVVNAPPQKKPVNEEEKNSLSLLDQMFLEQLKEAENYYALGVRANQRSKWEVAQENFEKALDRISNLSLDKEAESKWSEKINKLLHEISADYKITLLYLGALSSDASISAFVERFKDIENFKKLREQYKPEKPPETAERVVTYDMPIVLNEKVENCILYYQTIAREPFERYLKRSGKYISLMLEIIKEKGLPHDMVYLPIIESGFNPKAYSWAHAVGSWQFIKSTGRRYGLRRNHWYDERRDFVKSTYAACAYLKYLYNMFGDWLLALAAYNGGEGRVERQIKKQKTRNFWKLKLKKQTRNYVPLYMAATIIAKNPEEYGFHVDYDEPLEFDVVRVNKALDLKVVADALNVSVNTIKELNPKLLRGVTPPHYKNFPLRIPKGTKELFAQKYDEIPEKDLYGFHKIKWGETVSSIAKKYGVSPFSIIQANNLSKRYKIYAGDYLKIPRFKSKGSRKSSDYKYTHNSKGEKIYEVRKGDTLSEIAQAFGTTPQKIASLSGIRVKDPIYRGQNLKVAGSSPSNYKYEAGSKEGKIYTVKKGDTLSKIASAFGTTSQKIASLNGIRVKDPIYLGQKLVIPSFSYSSNYDYEMNSKGDKIYTVKKGDTLTEIARAFGTSSQKIASLNGISVGAPIYSGQKLKICGFSEDYLVYTVRKGETLWDISNKFKVTPYEIAQLNRIDKKDHIKVGQRLKIPSNGGSSRSDPGSKEKVIFHQVKKGDCLWDIAKRYGVSLKSLLSWNAISDPKSIKAGDKIRVYLR